jgi:hypothetical protein
MRRELSEKCSSPDVRNNARLARWFLVLPSLRQIAPMRNIPAENNAVVSSWNDGGKAPAASN